MSDSDDEGPAPAHKITGAENHPLVAEALRSRVPLTLNTTMSDADTAAVLSILPSDLMYCRATAEPFIPALRNMFGASVLFVFVESFPAGASYANGVNGANVVLRQDIYTAVVGTQLPPAPMTTICVSREPPLPALTAADFPLTMAAKGDLSVHTTFPDEFGAVILGAARATLDRLAPHGVDNLPELTGAISESISRATGIRDLTVFALTCDGEYFTSAHTHTSAMSIGTPYAVFQIQHWTPRAPMFIVPLQ